MGKLGINHTGQLSKRPWLKAIPALFLFLSISFLALQLVVWLSDSTSLSADRLPQYELRFHPHPTLRLHSDIDLADHNVSHSEVTLLQNPTLTGTLNFTKTVGVIPGACATTDDIRVLSGTSVYFCYQILNSTNVTLTRHQVADGALPDPLFELTGTFSSGHFTRTIRGPIVVTEDLISNNQTKAVLISRIANTAQTITAEDSANVRIATPGLAVSKRVTGRAIGVTAQDCGGASTITVPEGVEIQHCIVITNTGGNTDIITVTIDAPSLGIEAFSISRRIVPGSEYAFTAQEAIANGIGSPFISQQVNESFTTVITVTAFTEEGFPLIESAASSVSVSGKLDVSIAKRANSRPDTCTDSLFAVSANTRVYFCIYIENKGTFSLTSQQIEDSQLGINRVLPTDLVPGGIITQSLNFRDLNAPWTNTVSYSGQINTDLGSYIISKSAVKFVGIVPTAGTPTNTPTLTPIPPTATPGATATEVRKPLNTSTPFPTVTSTDTNTPVPNTVAPTSTPVSPLPTPTPTSTPVIVRAVESPPTTPTFTSTPSPPPTVDTAATSAALNATVLAGTGTAQAAETAVQLAQNQTLLPATEIPGDVSRQEEIDTPTSVAPSPTTIPTETSTPTPTETPPIPASTSSVALIVSSDIVTSAEVTASDLVTQVSSISDPAMPAPLDGDESLQVITNRATPNEPPPVVLLLIARIIDSTLAAAAWIWFLCGSMVFFVVSGLIAGLYFRRQEQQRFQLFETQSESSSEAGLDTTDESLESKFTESADTSDLPGVAGHRRDASVDTSQDEDDHWPASLP